MAKNKIQIEVEVNGKMQKATVSAKKLKKALDGAKTSQDELNTSTRQGYRAAQGAAQNTSNGTKAFAKQAGVVGGLVPIYATFAANVFAVSAAFGALRRAAAVQQLESSLERIGALAGRNLPAVAEDLKAITGAAVSTEQALKATAIATSSGFSQAQLLGLTKVAKGASIALGRDMGDALDRLIRGTAKLEPEILDELGIIVRLDKASADYATALGKTAQELTQFEKTQAFVNATITQGTNKYDEITKAIDPNPYDKLAAAFDNLSKSVINFINSGITPVIEFLSSNPTALAGALTLFAGTLFRQLTPAIQEFTETASKKFKFLALQAKKNAVKIQTEFSKTAKKLQTLSFAPKRAQELTGKAKAGTLTDKEALTFQRSLRAAIASRQRSVVELEKAIEKQSGKELAASKKKKLAIQEENNQLKAQLALVNQLANADRTRALGGGGVQEAGKKARNIKREAVGSRLEGRLLDKVDNQGAFGAVGTFFGSMPLFAKNTLKAEGAVGKLKVGMQGLASVGRIGLATFGKLIPVIGQALFIYSALKPVIDKVFGKSATQKSIDESRERFKIFTKTIQLLKQEISDTGSEFTKAFVKFRAAGGIFDEVAQAVLRLQETLDTQRREEIQNNLQRITSFETYGSKAGRSYAALGKMAGEARKNNIELFESLGQISKAGGEAILDGALASLGEGVKELPGVSKKFQEISDRIAAGEFGAGENIDGSALIEAIRLASDEARAFEGNIKGAGESSSAFFAEIAKLSKKTTTPYDSLIEKSKKFQEDIVAVRNQFTQGFIDDQGLTLKDAEIKVDSTSIDDLKAKFPEVERQAEFLSEKLNLEDPIKTFGTLKGAVESYNTKLEEANEILRNKTEILAEEEGRLSRLNKIREAGSAVIPVIQTQEDAVVDAKIRAVQAQISLVDLTEDEAAGLLKIQQLQNQIAGLELQRKTEAEKVYEQVQALVAEKQRELDLSQRNIAALRESFNIQKRAAELARENVQRQGFEGSRVFGQDAAREAKKAELQDALKFQKENEARINAEADIKKQQILIEYTLLDAKYAYLQEELRVSNLKLQNERKELEAKLATETDFAKRGEIQNQIIGLDDSSASLSASETALKNLRDQFGLLRDENGMVTGGTEGGLLQRILGNVDGAATNEVNSLRNSIKQLVFEVSQFDTIEATFNAGASSLRDNLGGALSDVLEGTKSVKEGFADLATGILKSMQRVLMDRVAEDFVNFLGGKAEGTFMERFFKPTNTTGVDTSDSGPLGPVTQPSQLPQTGVQTAATSPMPGIGGAMATAGAQMGAQMGTPVYLVPGMGLGGSAMNPLFVSMVQDPLTSAMGGEGAGAGAGAIPQALGGLSEEEDPATKATKELTEETKGLTLQSATNYAAMGTLIAGMTGNEKAAKALAMVTTGLQLAVMAQNLFQKTKMAKDMVKQTVETGLNTAATTANTTAQYASAGFRTGGISTPAGPMKGYSTGGISRGSQSGYPVTLHGTEAVVPLPNGKSIPVEVSGGGSSMNQNNVNVNVVMNSDGSAQSKTTEQEGRDAAELGRNISLAVQEELKKQKRSGGMLSPYGVA